MHLSLPFILVTQLTSAPLLVMFVTLTSILKPSFLIPSVTNDSSWLHLMWWVGLSLAFPPPGHVLNCSSWYTWLPSPQPHWSVWHPLNRMTLKAENNKAYWHSSWDHIPRPRFHGCDAVPLKTFFPKGFPLCNNQQLRTIPRFSMLQTWTLPFFKSAFSSACLGLFLLGELYLLLLFWFLIFLWLIIHDILFVLKWLVRFWFWQVFTGGTIDKEPSQQFKIRGFDLWVGKIPWKRAWQHTPVSLPGESHKQRSLVGYSLEDCRELDITEVT